MGVLCCDDNVWWKLLWVSYKRKNDLSSRDSRSGCFPTLQRPRYFVKSMVSAATLLLAFSIDVRFLPV